MRRIGLAMRFMFAAAVLLTSLPVLRAAEPTVAGRTLKEWIADLDAKDALVREEALEVLPEFGSDAKPATPKILKLYETDAPTVRYRAALAIWRIDGRTEPAQAVLSVALKTGSKSKRLQAVQLLSQLGRPASELAGPLLELMTGEPDYNVQNQVQVILAQFGSDAVPAMKDALAKARGDQRIQFMTLIQYLGAEFRPLLPLILEIRKDADPRTRFAAIRTIYVLDPQNKQVLTDIVEASKSKDIGIRREAFQAALYLAPRPKELAPVFRDFLKDDDVTTRCRAAAVLYEIDPTTLKETLPVVRKVLQEGGANTWSIAASALGSFGPAAKEALPDLTNLLKRPEGRSYGYMIVQACRAIGPEAVPLLLEVFEDPQAYYRSQAQQTLVMIGPDAIPKLLPALQHKNPAIRQAVVESIQRFGPGGRSAVATLAGSLKDEDAAVRDRVLTVFDSLGPDAKGAIPALRELLRDTKQDESRRWRAMDVLGKIGPEAKPALAEIEPFLKNANELVQCRAALAIARIDSTRRAEFMPLFLKPLREKKATPGLTGAYLIESLAQLEAPKADVMAGLLEFVKNQPGDSQLQVAQGLNTHYPDDKEALPVFREWWKSANPAIKIEAAIGLSRRKEQPGEVAPFLADQARIAGSPFRSRYLTALAEYGPAGKPAIPALLDLWRGDTTADSRFRTAEAILQIDPAQTGIRNWVRDQLRINPAAIQRQQAARVLAKVDPSYEQLRPVLERWAKEGNVTTSAAGMEILGLLGEHGKASVPLLRSALRESHPLKRVRAASSLWQIEKSPDAIPVLIKALGESDPLPSIGVYAGYVPVATRMASQHAANMLGEIGPGANEAIPALREAQLAADEGLRQAATAALKKIEVQK